LGSGTARALVGLVAHRQSDLGSGPLVSTTNLGQHLISGTLGRRTLLWGEVLKPDIRLSPTNSSGPPDGL
jgi:hypothetical protein